MGEVELCSTCEKVPSRCICTKPGPIAIALMTRPFDWAPKAREYLFTEEQIAHDYKRVLERRMNNGA